MSFTATDCLRFLSNPPKWLGNVAISVSNTISKPTVNGQPDDLTFRTPEDWMGLTGARATATGERAIPMYTLTKAKEGEVSFKAYIAEYNEGKTTPTVLGSGANLCFTANMNGCTFGIGTQATAADALLVSHGNAKGSSATAGLVGSGLKADTITALQSAVQYTWARELHGEGRVFEPEHYRTEGRQSITFGWREMGKKWKFYFQSYEPKGKKRVVYGVSPVGTNRIVDHSLTP